MEAKCKNKRIVSRMPVLPSMPVKKRVAAYARVSMEKEAMLHSLAAQVGYYSDLIRKNSEWEYAGVYAEMLTLTLIQMHPTCTQTAP